MLDRLRAQVAGVVERQNHPVNLAVLRILLFAYLARYVDLGQLRFYASLPAELLYPPFGSGWLLELIPPDPSIAVPAGVLFMIACVSACLGFRARISAAVAVLLGVYVLLIPQAYGKVNHYHHLLWFGGLLAASPCGNALSLDRWLKNRDFGFGLPYQRRYQTAFVVIWLLMGLIYFFPGIYKLAAGGWSFDWALSDNLRYFMWRQWFDTSVPPSLIRLDQVPWLYRAAGIGVILFEISFLFLVFLRSTHLWVALAGVAFHVGTGLSMGLWFMELIVVYVSFVDWRRHFTRWFGESVGSPGPDVESAFESSSLTLTLGAVLVVGGVVTGRYGIEGGWPFSLYPTFAEIREDSYVETLTLERTGQSRSRPQGSSTDDLREQLKRRFGGIRFEYLLRSILREDEAMERTRRLRGLVEVLERRSLLQAGERIRIYQIEVSTRPGQRGQRRGAAELVAELSTSGRSSLNRD